MADDEKDRVGLVAPDPNAVHVVVPAFWYAHTLLVGFPVDMSLNVTFHEQTQLVWAAVKSAVSGGAVTVIGFDLVPVNPAELVTVSVTV